MTPQATYQNRLQAADEWLIANICTTEDARTLAEHLDTAMLRFDNGVSRASAVTSAIQHYYGPCDWTATIREAEEILRQRYGRLWTYVGD